MAYPQPNHSSHQYQQPQQQQQQQHFTTSPRRNVSGGTVDMNAVRTYQNQALSSPGSAGGYPYNYIGTPTSASSPAAPYGRYQSPVYQQQHPSTTSLSGQYAQAAPASYRRPSMSPGRTGGDNYNPRDYGVLAGRDAGVTHVSTPVTGASAGTGSEEAPPPYSPPQNRPGASGRGAPSPITLPHQNSWQSQRESLQTPQTPASHVFSPGIRGSGYMAGSSAATTPMSPFPSGGFNERSGQSSTEFNGGIPPPPPGPPPRGISAERQQSLMRSSSGFYRDSSPHAPSALRNESPAAPSEQTRSEAATSSTNTTRPTAASPSSQQQFVSNFRPRVATGSAPSRAESQSPAVRARNSPPSMAHSNVGSPLAQNSSPAPKRKMSHEDDLRSDRLSPRLTAFGDTNPWNKIRAANQINQSSATGLLSPAKDGFSEEPALVDLSSDKIDGADSRMQSDIDASSQKRGQSARQLLTPPPNDSTPRPTLQIPPNQPKTAPNSAYPRVATALSPVGEEASMDPVYMAAIARHNEMIQHEAFASSDEERLRIFVKYVQEECRHRSRLYPAAVERLKGWLKQSQVGFINENMEKDIEMQDTISPISSRARGEWWGQYLSAKTSNRDPDGESRGRQSSRWWEASAEGGSVSDAVRSDGMADEEMFARRFKRRSSLREIAKLQLQTPNPQDPMSYIGSSAYPPEKGHRNEQSPRPAQQNMVSRPIQTPRTTRPRITRLDILPLLTLLPPYPSMYPAVNNQHPKLASFRNLVRNLNEMEEVDRPQKTYEEENNRMLEANTVEALERRRQHSERLQKLYSTGQLTFNELTQLTTQFDESEKRKLQELMKSSFDKYNTEVVEPVYKTLTERIELTSAAIISLKEMLHPRLPPVNATDETPSLHETLTALKWLFELRETLHSRIHDLLRTRNTYYKNLTTVSLTGEKLQDAENFFNNNLRELDLKSHTESLERTNEILDVFEEQVTQGVEVLISMFWESAPLVAECFEKIPQDLTHVVPIVPPEDAHENPSWEQEPMKYLYEKVLHAEKSMYSLVEANTELLCLLHEIKSCGLRVEYRVKRSQGESTGGEAMEERKLTDDLKEKVRTVEDQWKNILGEVLDRVKKRIESTIIAAGGSIERSEDA